MSGDVAMSERDGWRIYAEGDRVLFEARRDGESTGRLDISDAWEIGRTQQFIIRTNGEKGIRGLLVYIGCAKIWPCEAKP
jgi:hypothetical protein